MQHMRTLDPAPPDPILDLTEAYRADPNPQKINLGAGVYQDSQGRTPVLECVKEAELLLLQQEQSKAYLPIPGSREYGALVRQLIFGVGCAQAENGCAVTCHCPGGTGALRVGADFLRELYPEARVWFSRPTWANHKGIFAAARWEAREYAYFDRERQELDFAAMKADLKTIPANDVVVLHVCCHNPTGVDLEPAQWREVAAIAAEQGWTPFLDFAYQGFGAGLEDDRAAVTACLEAGLEFLVASSFSKNFSLYNERAGALTLSLSDPQKATAYFSHLRRTVRVNYSNPAAHGGLIVQTVLQDEALRARWQQDLATMRERVIAMRSMFVERMKALVPSADFSFIARQHGMFSFSGLSAAQVRFLREQRSIYMVGDSRVNVAGMTPDGMEYLCQSVAEALAVAG
jgi:aromatic-amino-acid transaminase